MAQPEDSLALKVAEEATEPTLTDRLLLFNVGFVELLNPGYAEYIGELKQLHASEQWDRYRAKAKRVVSAKQYEAKVGLNPELIRTPDFSNYRLYAHDLHQAVPFSKLTRVEGPLVFLDVGCAPGGFSMKTLEENPQALGLGLTLPHYLGGNPVFAELATQVPDAQYRIEYGDLLDTPTFEQLVRTVRNEPRFQRGVHLAFADASYHPLHHPAVAMKVPHEDWLTPLCFPLDPPSSYTQAQDQAHEDTKDQVQADADESYWQQWQQLPTSEQDLARQYYVEKVRNHLLLLHRQLYLALLKLKRGGTLMLRTHLIPQGANVVLQLLLCSFFDNVYAVKPSTKFALERSFYLILTGFGGLPEGFLDSWFRHLRVRRSPVAELDPVDMDSPDIMRERYAAWCTQHLHALDFFMLEMAELHCGVGTVKMLAAALRGVMEKSLSLVRQFLSGSKLDICRFHSSRMGCKWGSACYFAHSPEEAVTEVQTAQRTFHKWRESTRKPSRQWRRRQNNRQSRSRQKAWKPKSGTHWADTC